MPTAHPQRRVQIDRINLHQRVPPHQSMHLVGQHILRCLIPQFDGAILSQEWKEALWDKFVMAAPRPRTPSEQQYSDRKLRSRS
jgi:hypothetical protein